MILVLLDLSADLAKIITLHISQVCVTLCMIFLVCYVECDRAQFCGVRQGSVLRSM